MDGTFRINTQLHVNDLQKAYATFMCEYRLSGQVTCILRTRGSRISSPMHPMPPPLPQLPGEIALAIVSHLSQVDIVECMRVSREWYNAIPALAAIPWYQLDVSPLSWRTINDCMLQCLFHVRTMTIRTSNASAVLQKLATFPTSLLETTKGIVNRDTEGNDLPTTTIMQQFKYTLTQLAIVDNLFIISATQLLDSLPSLTHFTLLYDDVDLLNMDTSYEMKTELSHLVYLHLDTYSRCYVIPILRRSRKLKSLLVTEVSSEDFVADGHDLDMAFELCPHLRCVIWNTDYLSYDKKIQEFKKTAQVDDNNGFLRMLVFQGDFNRLRQVIPVLARSRHHLEHLEIYNDEPNGSQIIYTLSNISFPRLKILDMLGSTMSRNAWVNLLKGLKDLGRLSIHLPDEIISLDPVLEAISSLRYLRRLDLFYVDGLLHCRFPIHHIGILARLTQLCVLWLKGTCISDNGFAALATILSLEEIHVAMDCVCLSVEGMMAFADNLLALTDRSNLRSLSMDQVCNMNDRFLQQISKVPGLTKVSFSENSHVTDDGVKALARGGKTVFVYPKCPHISRYGTWTANDSH
ncbi:hypothetical protein BJV82DRAFT_185810 [Fennellomyces sp. T-0311]|nr:hypothetical protein BJV82DRAFT_185810 [Fennellomyces sp. T-0311]